MFKKVILSIVLGTVLYAGYSKDVISGEIDDFQKIKKIKSVNLKIGTLGVGVDYTVPLEENIQLRLNVNGLAYESDDENIEGIMYNADVTLFTAGMLIDYFLSSDSRFHLTGGAYYNGNKLEAVAKPGERGIEINGVSYFDNMVHELDIDVEFDGFAPYVGIGWCSRETTGGWSFVADIGILYQGKGDVTLTPQYGTDATNPVMTAGRLMLDQNIANEKLEIEDAIDDYEYYPVIMLGATYKF